MSRCVLLGHNFDIVEKQSVGLRIRGALNKEDACCPVEIERMDRRSRELTQWNFDLNPPVPRKTAMNFKGSREIFRGIS